MQQQDLNDKKQIQNSNTLKNNTQSDTIQSSIHQKQNNNADIQKMSVEKYALFLKQYRTIVKPPFKDEETQKVFIERFDKVIIQKSLCLLGNFIKEQKRREKLQKKEHSQNKKQNNQYKIQKKLSNIEQISQELQKKQSQRKTNFELHDKILLYTWQLSNIRTIISNHQNYSISETQLHNFHRLCIITSRIYVSKWGVRHVTLQAMQIAYFNLLKNKIFNADPDRNGSICCLIEALLGDTEMQECGKYINIYNKTFQIIQENQPEIQGKIVEGQDKRKRGIINCERSTQKNHTCKFSPSKQSLKSPCKQKNRQKISQKKIQKKSEAQLELEWLIYIIQFCINNSQSFIKSTYIQLSNGNLHLVTHSAISFIHFISLLLNKIINDRTTTQIVKGYVCPIQEVRNMYNMKSNEGKSTIDIKINWADYEWICQYLLKQLYTRYKQQLCKVWSCYKNQIKDQDQIEYDSSYIECIMNILSIVNSCNFLGGYNTQLQKKTTKLLLSFGLQFLQITYLIYQLSHVKKRKVSMTSNQGEQMIKKEYIKNLQNILGYQDRKISGEAFQISLVKINSSQQKNNEQPLSQQKVQQNKPSGQNNELYQVLPLEQGQIVAILRMLSNLVHINTQAQKHFEQNLKYFRIVMSLTHQNQKQLTMKNWAIVFLKNVAERSSIMREQLQKLKIDIKVDEGTNNFM